MRLLTAVNAALYMNNLSTIFRAKKASAVTGPKQFTV